MDIPSVLSVNVGLPRIWYWHGKEVLSAIDKRPVSGPITVRRDDFDGDRQADLTVHGGPEKAVYVYPAAYYALWKRELPKMDLPWGMFGENLTIEGLDDTTVQIGDQYAIGTATLVVTQPRMPCYKLGMKFGRDTFLKQFLQSRRTGFYFSVQTEGEIAVGDAVRLARRTSNSVTVADIVRLYAFDRKDVAGLMRAIAAPALPEQWREIFRERLEQLVR
jgi:MOSC domain-containing protein YiiM